MISNKTCAVHRRWLIMYNSGVTNSTRPVELMVEP